MSIVYINIGKSECNLYNLNDWFFSEPKNKVVVRGNVWCSECTFYFKNLKVFD